jgi:hypothetical protein
MVTGVRCAKLEVHPPLVGILHARRTEKPFGQRSRDPFCRHRRRPAVSGRSGGERARARIGRVQQWRLEPMRGDRRLPRLPSAEQGRVSSVPCAPSPVQSSPVQSSPVQSSPVQSSAHPMAPTSLEHSRRRGPSRKCDERESRKEGCWHAQRRSSRETTLEPHRHTPEWRRSRALVGSSCCCAWDYVIAPHHCRPSCISTGRGCCCASGSCRLALEKRLKPGILPLQPLVVLLRDTTMLRAPLRAWVPGGAWAGGRAGFVCLFVCLFVCCVSCELCGGM